MTPLRPVSLFAALATIALVTTLTTTPATARSLDDIEQPEVSSAASGAITGRVLIEAFDGGTPFAANSGQVNVYSLDDFGNVPQGFGVLSSSGTFSIPGLPAGQYLVSFQSDDLRGFPVREWHDNESNSLLATPITLLEGQPYSFGDVFLDGRTIETGRIAGANRFGTAAQVSVRYNSEGAERNIVIVNGLNFPDALSAGPLAARPFGELLMVTQNSIPAETAAELVRLDPQSITIVGSTGVVSAAVEAQLASYVGGPVNVRRIEGSDRYSTSREVVELMDSEISIGRLFVATGRGFPDALAAVPAAGTQGALLLVDGTRSTLDASTAAFIDGLNVPVTIVGGTSVVSSGIQSQLDGLGVDIDRVAGTNRYTTSIAVAIQFFPRSDFAYLANGLGFADALAVGPWAAKLNSPVYLTQPTCVTDAVFDDILAGFFSRVTLVGGTSALSPNVQSLNPCTP